MEDKLFVVIPAYNEKENLAYVINDWYPIAEAVGRDSRLIIIDDGSKDNTYEIIKEMAKTRPMLEPLTKPNTRKH